MPLALRPLYSISAPVVLMALIGAGLTKFEEDCIDAIIDQSPPPYSTSFFHSGAGRDLLIASAVFIGISSWFAYTLVAVGTAIMRYRKKLIVKWIEDPVSSGDNDASIHSAL
jgi:hypothetical protein